MVETKEHHEVKGKQLEFILFCLFLALVISKETDTIANKKNPLTPTDIPSKIFIYNSTGLQSTSVEVSATTTSASTASSSTTSTTTTLPN